MKRLGPSLHSSIVTLVVVGAAALLLAVVALVPTETGEAIGPGSDRASTKRDAPGDPSSDTGQDGQEAGPAGEDGRAGESGRGGGGSNTATGEPCAARDNGGSTDVGVTGSAIKIAATIVADGPGSSFLGPVRIGMQTVVNTVNRRPGRICGRQLSLALRNDSWDATRGQQYIRNFVEGDKVFALAVVPSSEGLEAADDYVKTQKVPVVGTDGMLIKQYLNPWIWPVATSTISTMHVMAKNAHERGAEQFAIVFDAKYHFGVEGAFAFNQAVKRLTGRDIAGFDPSLKNCREKFCGIQPGKPSYASEAQSLNRTCFNTAGGKGCDFIAFLLEPDTAASFLREGRPANPAVGFAGAQPLFNRTFAENCRSLCDGMWVWTGYNPPIEALASTPGVSKYVNEVRAESASADVSNQFLQGGYLGMSLLVAALDKVGPKLTRANLRATLDSMTFDIGLSKPLSWRAGDHFANVSAQAFEIQYKQSFNGWRQKTSFIDDPWVGEDIP